MDRLGVGWEALSARNPKLVMCSITGYGQDGPFASRAGHDINYTATAGVLGLNGEAGGPPAPPSGQGGGSAGGGGPPAGSSGVAPPPGRGGGGGRVPRVVVARRAA